MPEQDKTDGAMNCGVVSELLEPYHAGKLNARAEQSIREHLGQCAACSVRLASIERQAKAAAEGLPLESADALDASGQTSGSWWRGAPKLAMLVIGLAIVVVPGSFWFANSRMRQAKAPMVDADVPSLAALRRMGDDETRSVQFNLHEPTNVRVYALGEGIGGAMYDYGWIVDARSRRTVWSMEYSDTKPAGGDDKNRMVDDVISLNPGSYVLRYTTDGSHSYEDWNADPPRDSEAWGITVTVADGMRPPVPKPPRPERARGELAEVIATATAEAMEAARLATAEAARVTRTEIAREMRRRSTDAGVVARLVRVGDDEDLRQTFVLDDESRILIYALGEATGGEMHDYAWIVDEGNGRTVWQMTYDNTGHAGGAEKNRVAEDIIRLPAGEYTVRYRSDDSHSFNSWNSDAPRDAANYGVTLFRVEER